MHLQLRLKCESRFRSRNNKDAGKLCFSKAKRREIMQEIAFIMDVNLEEIQKGQMN